MSNANYAEQAGPEQQVKMHVSPDLEYIYRDVINIFVGAGDVVFEFGNLHRSMPGNGTIGNRVVLSMANAYELQSKLQQVLTQAQQSFQNRQSSDMGGKG